MPAKSDKILSSHPFGRHRVYDVHANCPLDKKDTFYNLAYVIHSNG